MKKAPWEQNASILKELIGALAKKDISEILLPRNFLLVEMTVEIVFISKPGLIGRDIILIRDRMHVMSSE